MSLGQISLVLMQLGPMKQHPNKNSIIYSLISPFFLPNRISYTKFFILIITSLKTYLLYFPKVFSAWQKPVYVLDLVSFLPTNIYIHICICNICLLVAKLLYKYKCPSVCPYVRQPR